jgi:hypothetical protein
MKTLPELLKDHERTLRELTNPLYSNTTTPEVRAILIDTCKNAIEHIKRDIEEDEDEPKWKEILPKTCQRQDR